MFRSIKNFINDNKFLSFIVLISLIDMMSLKHDINTLIVIIVGTIVAIFIDKIGHVLHYLSLNKLTSQLSETNLALAKSENRFRNFFNQTNTPMCIFSLKTKK